MSGPKERTTLAKHAREQAVHARRLEKQAGKDARKEASARADGPGPGTGSGDGS